MLTDEQKRWIEMAVKQAKNQKESMFELSTFAVDELLKENRAIQQQNKQLIEEKEELQKSFQQVNDDYRSLINIMDRARRLAMMVAEEEEEERPRFKMDANGNLTRIE